jgi:hypothetical protein
MREPGTASLVKYFFEDRICQVFGAFARSPEALQDIFSWQISQLTGRAKKPIFERNLYLKSTLQKLLEFAADPIRVIERAIFIYKASFRTCQIQVI